MGAQIQITTVEAEDKKQLKDQYDALVESALYDHGHAGYTGSFAESPGLTILEKEFEDEDKAEEYILDHCCKWENSLAARVKGTNTWVVGGLFSS
jgi:hypothetical protein